MNKANKRRAKDKLPKQAIEAKFLADSYLKLRINLQF
jgi:hypothetical protein